MKPSRQIELLGRCLALYPDTGLGPDPTLPCDLTAAPWPELLQRAGGHLVTPTLAANLADVGLLDALPGEVQDYLRTVRDLNRARNATLYAELCRVAAALNAVDIEPQTLKGAAALLPEQYPGAQDRLIGDLDLGVPGERYRDAARAVRALGYRMAEVHGPDPGDHHHGAALLHPSEPVTVELHLRTLYNRDDNDRLWRATRLSTVSLPATALRVQLADPATRILHNFLHGQINDRCHVQRRLDLRQLLDFARLIGHYRAEIEWRAMLDRLRKRHHRGFRLYLLAAEHWLGEPYPEELGRPVGGRAVLRLVSLAQSGPRWYRFFATLPRLLNLPRRLVTPAWYGMKLRALRRGEPW